MCILTDNIMDYHIVSQGKTTIPNVDDGEEFRDTDVSHYIIFLQWLQTKNNLWRLIAI